MRYLIVSAVLFLPLVSNAQQELGDLEKVRLHVSSFLARKGSSTAVPHFNFQMGVEEWDGTEINTPVDTETITDQAAVIACAQAALNESNSNCFYPEPYTYTCGYYNFNGISFPETCVRINWRYNSDCGSSNYAELIAQIEAGTHPCVTNNTSEHPVSRNSRFLNIEAGVDYSLTITGGNSLYVQSALLVPDTHMVFIKGAGGVYKPASVSVMNFGEGSKTIDFQIREVGGKAPPLLGQSSNLNIGDLRWELPLGTLGNGDTAGRLVLHERDLTAASYTRTALRYYLPLSDGTGEVEAVKVGGLLRQIKTPGSFIDLVDTVTSSGAVIQYEVRMYSPLAAGAGKSGGLYSTAGLTMLAKYAIGRDAGQTLNHFFVKQYDGAGSLLRTEQAQKGDTGTSVNGIPLIHWQSQTTANSESAPVARTYQALNSAASGTRQESQEVGQSSRKYPEEDNNFVTQRNYLNLAGAGEVKVYEGRAQNFTAAGPLGGFVGKGYSYLYGTDPGHPATYGQKVLSIDHFCGFKYQLANDNPLSVDFAEDSLLIEPSDEPFDPGLFFSNTMVDHDANPATPDVVEWVGAVLQANNRLKYSLITRGQDYDGVSRRDTETIVTRNGSGSLSSLTPLAARMARPRFYAYGTERLEVLCSYQPYDFPENTNRRRPTFTANYAPDTANRRLMGKPRFVYRPDGTKTSYGYLEGTYRGVANAFVTLEVNGYHGTALTPIEQGATPALSAVSHGAANHAVSGVGTFAIDAVLLEPGKSTRTVTIRNRNGWVMFIESWAYTTASQWVKIDDIANTHDVFGRLTQTVRDGRTVQEANWSGLRKRWEKDEAGIKTDYSYDGLGRVITETISGAAGVAGIPSSKTTHLYYDARDRVVVKETDAGGELLVEKKVYDAEGYLVSETSASGLVTHYWYDLVNQAGFIGMVRTTELPDGTKKREFIKQNGQPWKEERLDAGNTVFETVTYDYGSNVAAPAGSGLPSSNRLVRVDFQPGTAGHSYSEQYSDASGVARFERSSTSTANPFERKSLVDPSTGQLTGTLETEVATNGAVSLSLGKSIFYDNLGQPYRSGLDVDGGGIALGGTDRVTDEQSRIIAYGGATWRETATTTYPADGQTSAFTTYERVKLTGLSASTLAVKETEDVHGNKKTITTTVNRANATITVATQFPDGSSTAAVTVNGLQKSATDRQGNVTQFEYDAAGRLRKSTDGRGISTVSEYYPASPLVRIARSGVTAANATGYPVEFTYVPQGSYGAGKPSTTTDAATRVTRQSYDHRGNVTHTWGASVHPVLLEYDSLGRLWKRHTFASSGASFDGAAWPAGAGGGDVTTYSYYGGTELMQSRSDAAGRTSTHVYDERGRLVSSVLPGSAADNDTVATSAVTVLRQYHPKTDLPLLVDYSDATPDLSYTYHRNGTVKTVTDAAGTRTFHYQLNPGGAASQKLQILGETLPGAYASLTGLAVGPAEFVFDTIGFAFQTSNGSGAMVGRPAGVRMGQGSGGVVGTPRYASGYGYDASGRVNSIGIEAATVGYGYLPNSNLPQTRQSTANLVETSGYEPDRNLLRSISTTGSGQLKLSHVHAHDILGRRDDLTQSGQHFAPYGGTLYTDYRYTNRDELKDFDVKIGSAGGTIVAGRSQGFVYDQLGNRTKFTRKDAPSGQREFDYTPNSLNQYSNRQTPDWAEVSGIIGTSIRPSVGVWPTTASTATRNGEYFHVFRPLRAGPASQAHDQDLILVQQGAGGADPENGGQKDLISKQTVRLGLRAAPETFKHDARGNLREDSQWIYHWDAADRLIGIETRTEAISSGVKPVKLAFRYDHLNRRYSKETFSHTGGSWSSQPEKITLYYWHNWTLLAEATYATVWSGAALSSATFETGSKYYWGLDWSGSLEGAGGVRGLIGIIRKEGPAATQAPVYPGYDANGNVMALFDSAGNSVAAYEYDPFGRVIRATGSLAKKNHIRFATKLHDPETGLVYHNARYYSPDLGRFISQDPIGESGGTNLYAFVNNNPAGNIDVLGYAVSSLDSYTLSSSTNLYGLTTFDSRSFQADYNRFSGSVYSIYQDAGYQFSQKHLPGDVSLHNDWSNMGSWLGNVWDRNIAKNTTFNNNYWEPRFANQIGESFFGNPLSFSGYGYSMLSGALSNLSALRTFAEAHPYDDQGAWTRLAEIGSGTLDVPGHFLAEAFNMITLPRITTGQEVTFNGWTNLPGLNEVSTGARVFEAAAIFLPMRIPGAGLADNGLTLLDDGMRAANGGVLNASRGIPKTGIARFDQLAVESSHFDRAISGIKSRGFQVREAPLGASNPAFIKPGNRTFYYDPKHMTYLDLRHEINHIQQFKLNGSMQIGGGRGSRFEFGSYMLERSLGNRHGFSGEYMDYLGRQLSGYGSFLMPP